MNLSPVLLELALASYRLSKEQYQVFSMQLSKLGFNEESVNTIILHRDSIRTIGVLIQHYGPLRTFFTMDQLTTLANWDCAFQRLEVILALFKFWTSHFTAEQIMRITTHETGGSNLTALLNNYAQLRVLNVSEEQMVRVIEYNNGHLNINALTLYLENNKNCDPGFVIDLASKKNAYLTLKDLPASARATQEPRPKPFEQAPLHKEAGNFSKTQSIFSSPNTASSTGTNTDSSEFGWLLDMVNGTSTATF